MNQSQISLPKFGLIYLVIYLALIVLLFLCLWALEAFFQFTTTSNSFGVVMPMLAAMQVGTIWYNRTSARPSGAMAWMAATLFAVITLLVSFLIGTLLYSNGLLPELAGIATDPDAPMIMALIAGGGFVLTLLLCRVGLYFGSRQAEKLQQRQNAKTSK